MASFSKSSAPIRLSRQRSTLPAINKSNNAPPPIRSSGLSQTFSLLPGLFFRRAQPNRPLFRRVTGASAPPAPVVEAVSDESPTKPSNGAGAGGIPGAGGMPVPGGEIGSATGTLSGVGAAGWAGLLWPGCAAGGEGAGGLGGGGFGAGLLFAGAGLVISSSNGASPSSSACVSCSQPNWAFCGGAVGG